MDTQATAPAVVAYFDQLTAMLHTAPPQIKAVITVTDDGYCYLQSSDPHIIDVETLSLITTEPT